LLSYVLGLDESPGRLVSYPSFPPAEVVIPLLYQWFGRAISELNPEHVLRVVAGTVEIVNMNGVGENRVGQRAHAMAVFPLLSFVLRQVTISWAGDHPLLTYSVVVLLAQWAQRLNSSLSCWQFAMRCPHWLGPRSMSVWVLFVRSVAVQAGMRAWLLGGGRCSLVLANCPCQPCSRFAVTDRSRPDWLARAIFCQVIALVAVVIVFWIVAAFTVGSFREGCQEQFSGIFRVINCWDQWGLRLTRTERYASCVCESNVACCGENCISEGKGRQMFCGRLSALDPPSVNGP
jgi:hypothetical protein